MHSGYQASSPRKHASYWGKKRHNGYFSHQTPKPGKCQIPTNYKNHKKHNWSFTSWNQFVFAHLYANNLWYREPWVGMGKAGRGSPLGLAGAKAPGGAMPSPGEAAYIRRVCGRERRCGVSCCDLLKIPKWILPGSVGETKIEVIFTVMHSKYICEK